MHELIHVKSGGITEIGNLHPGVRLHLQESAWLIHCLDVEFACYELISGEGDLSGKPRLLIKW